MNVKNSFAIVLILVFLGGNLIFAQSTKGDIYTETIRYAVDGQNFMLMQGFLMTQLYMLLKILRVFGK